LCSQLFTVRDAKDKEDVSFLVGFETEVVFLEDGVFPPKALTNGSWSSSLAFRSHSRGKKIVEEIYDVLTESGIEVQQFHAESAAGQYEIVTGPLPPMEAVDALVFTRDTIYNIAAKHGARATLYPKVYKDACIPFLMDGGDSRWYSESSPCQFETGKWQRVRGREGRGSA